MKLVYLRLNSDITHMPIDGLAHYVFVDFENVPTVDLALIAGQSVHVTLLIGEKQKKLELTLVHQIHRNAAQVTLVEVGASGRNALDMVLACHLGQAVVMTPGAAFHIISKDKDFNPLVAHLRANEVNIARHDNFAALPFLQPAAAKLPDPDRRLNKLITGLRNAGASRPVRRKTLVSHIQDLFANRLTDAEVKSIIATLQQRGVIAIDERDRVSYEDSPPPAREPRDAARSPTGAERKPLRAERQTRSTAAPAGTDPSDKVAPAPATGASASASGHRHRLAPGG